MKKKILVWVVMFFCLILLAGCGYLVFYMLDNNIISSFAKLYYGGEQFSPDHRSIIFASEDVPVAVVSLTNLKIYQSPSLPALGDYTNFASWFPDNSGFVIMDADKGCEKCSFDRLRVYQINSKNNFLQQNIFEPLKERNDSFWSNISWSPDGSSFAVVVNQQEIDILNRQAQVVEKFLPDLKTNSSWIDSANWTPYGLIYKTRYDNPYPQPQLTELFLLDSAHAELKETRLLTSNAYPEFISYDPFSPRVIIMQDQNPEIFDNKLDFVIFNLETRKLEKVIYTIMGGPNTNYKISSDSTMVGMMGNVEENNFYIYDWKSQTFFDLHMHIKDILAWDPIAQAFIVLKKDAAGHEWTEAVQP